LRASIAEYERLKIHERMARGRVLKVRSGSVMVHGRPPFGYSREVEGGKFVLLVKESEAYIVRLVFDWYTGGDGAGALSLAEIKDRLDDMAALTCYDTRNIHNKVRERGEWSRGSIQKILRNETYAGIWRYHRDHVHNDSLAVAVPAVVDRETWERAQAILAYNREARRRRPHHDYQLSGRLRCADCGARIVASTIGAEKQRVYYLCQARRQYARPCNMSKRFKASTVDATAWGWVKSLLLDPAELARGLAEHQTERDMENAPMRERLSAAEDLLRDHRTQLERLLDLYLAGDFPKDILTERKARLEATIAALERERAGILTQLGATTLTQEQIKSLQDSAHEVAVGFIGADTDFGARRQVIEDLKLEGRLAIEEDQQVMYLTCIVGEKRMDIVNPNKDEERARSATLAC
jgi:site-specific DNA recombinase